jgi:hypothetical protein
MNSIALVERFIYENDIDSFKLIVENHKHKNFLKHKILLLVCKSGKLPFLRILYKEIKDCFFENEVVNKNEDIDPLLISCENGHLNLVEFMFEQPEFIQNKLQLFKCLEKSIENSHIDITDLLLKKIGDLSKILKEKLFDISTQKSDLNTLVYLFNNIRLSINEDNKKKYFINCLLSQTNKVEFIIKKLKIQTEDVYYSSLYYAVYQENLELITLLMKNEKLSPVNNFNYIETDFSQAYKKNNLDILKIFLQHRDTIPYLQKNRPDILQQVKKDILEINVNNF